MKKILFAAFFFCFLTNLSAQSLLKYVPKDATMVVSMNPGNLNKKFPLSNIQAYDFYEMGMMQMTSSLGEEAGTMIDVIQNPESVGMNLMESSYFFGKMDMKDIYFGYVFKLSNMEKFNQFLKDQMGEGFNMMVEQKGDLFQFSPEESALITWNNEMVMIGGRQLGFQSEENQGAGITLNDWVNNNLNRTADQSIQSNAYFQKAISKPSDFHFWMDYSVVAKMMEENGGMADAFGDNPMGAMAMGKFMDTFYKDVYLSMGLNFDAGKIAYSTDYFGNENIQKLFVGASEGKFNKKFLKYVKADNLLGYWGMSFDSKKTGEAYGDLIAETLGEIPMYGSLAKDGLDILGIFIDEDAIYDLFKGDMMLAVTGVQTIKKATTKYEYDEDFNSTEVETIEDQQIPEMTMMMSYGNEENLMKFINLGVNANVLQKEGNHFKMTIPNVNVDAYIALKKGILFISNSEDLIKNRLDTGYPKKNRMAKNHCKMLKENAQVLYWDIPNTISVFEKGEAMPGPAGQFMNVGKQNFESIQFVTSRKVENSINSEFSINLADKETNSLKFLLDLVNKMFLEMMGGGSST